MKTVIRSLTATLRSSLPVSGSARRRRMASAFRSSALIDVLEARLLLAADLGDAPDTSSATGVENYQTLTANNGPRHTIDQTQTTLFLGAGVDGDNGAQQSSGAQADDLFAASGRDDEDGVLNPLDLQAAAGTNPVVTLQATNTTNRAATLYGWIDLNRNGLFENATERTQIAVPAGTDDQRFTLTFPLATAGSIGKTYARFRISTDVASANSLGLASDGEVEDYRFTINNRVAFPLSTVSTVTLGAEISQPSSNWPLTFLGFDVAPIGDLDQNGTQDYVVTDPMDGGDIQQSGPKGAAYVVFQNANGTVLKSVRIASNRNGGPALNSEDVFGASVTSLGDIDGDGITDLAIGAPGDGTGGAERGAVYIVRLKSDGTAKSTTKIANALNGGPVLQNGDGFGMSIASPGDMDGDGVVDLVVAASQADVGGEDRGVVYTMFLKADGTVRNFATIENTTAWNSTIEEEENFGARITSIGDVNGDGVADLASLSGSYVNFDGSVESLPKQIDILLMNANGTMKQFVGIGDGLNGGPDLVDNDAIWDLTSVGDVDADGIEDLAVIIGDAKGEGSSRLQVITLTPQGRAKSVQQLSMSNSAYLSSLTNLGDTNNDGKMELAWGMPLNGGFNAPRGIFKIITLENATIRSASPAVPSFDRTITRTRNPRPQISWSDVAEESNYEVWIRNEDTGVVLVSSAIVSANSYTPTMDLVPGKYGIAVRARNEAGVSAWSARYELTVVRVVQINPVATNWKPEITWNRLNETSRYEVWINKAATPETPFVKGTTEAGATRFVPSTSLPSGNYRVLVREITANGVTGLWSEPGQLTIAAKATMSRVSRQITNRPLIEWQTLVGAVKYDLWIASLDQPARPHIRVTTTTAATSYQPDALPAGRYQVWVRGVDLNGAVGEWSVGYAFRSQITPVMRTEPYQLPLGSRGTVTWSIEEEAPTYQVWVDDPTPGLTPLSSIVSVQSKLTSVDMTMIGKYRVWVRAITADGFVGAWSAPAVLISDAKPVELSMNSADVTRPEFRWKSVAGANRYDIRVTSIETNAVVVSAVRHSTGTPTTSYKLVDALPIGKYQFTVRAIAFESIAGSWSESLNYNSTLAPVLKTVQPGLESNVKLEWTAAANSGPINFTVMDTVTRRIVSSGRAPAGIASTTVGLAEGSYRWWTMSTSHGMWSLPGEFVVKRGTVFNNQASFQAGSAVILSWDRIPAARLYDVWIADERGITVYRNQSVDGLQVSLPNTFASGRYRAWVRAISENSVAARWSSRFDFIVQPIS
jgi:hypothetical protein